MKSSIITVAMALTAIGLALTGHCEPAMTCAVGCWVILALREDRE